MTCLRVGREGEEPLRVGSEGEESKFILSFHKSLGRRLVSLITRAGVFRGEGGSGGGGGEVGKEEGEG